MNIDDIINEEHQRFIQEIITSNSTIPTFHYENYDSDNSIFRYRIFVKVPEKNIDTTTLLLLRKGSEDEDSYEIMFKNEFGDYRDKTGLGVQFRLMATITKIVKEFEERYSPNMFFFSPINDDVKRGRLYMQYVRGALSANYDVFVLENQLFYVIEKRTTNLPAELLQKLASKITDGRYDNEYKSIDDSRISVYYRSHNFRYRGIGDGYGEFRSVRKFGEMLKSIPNLTFYKDGEYITIEEVGELKALTGQQPQQQVQQQAQPQQSTVNQGQQAIINNPNLNFLDWFATNLGNGFPQVAPYADMIKSPSDLMELNRRARQSMQTVDRQQLQRVKNIIQQSEQLYNAWMQLHPEPVSESLELDEIITANSNIKTYPYMKNKTYSSADVTIYDIMINDREKGIDDITYQVNFQKHSSEEKSYSVSFRKEYGKYDDVTNMGIQYRIMATITKVVQEFLNETQLNVLIYEPIKSRGNDDNRRAKLYMEYIKGAMGEDFDVFVIGDQKRFYIERRTNRISTDKIQKVLTLLSIHGGMYLTKGIPYSDPNYRKFRMNSSGDMFMFSQGDMYKEYTSCRNYVTTLAGTPNLEYVRGGNEPFDDDSNLKTPLDTPLRSDDINQPANQQQIDEIIMSGKMATYPYEQTEYDSGYAWIIHTDVVDTEKHYDDEEDKQRTVDFMVYFYDHDNGKYSLSFKKVGGMYDAKENLGIQYKLMATIINIVKEFADKYGFESLKYHPVDADPKRAKLYSIYAQGSIGDKYDLFQLPEYNTVIEKKTNLPATEMQEVINYLTKDKNGAKFHYRDGNSEINFNFDYEYPMSEIDNDIDNDVVYYKSIHQFFTELLKHPELRFYPRNPYNFHSEEEYQREIANVPDVVKNFIKNHSTVTSQQPANVNEQVLDEIIPSGKVPLLPYTYEGLDGWGEEYVIKIDIPEKQISSRISVHFGNFADSSYALTFKEVGGDYEDKLNFGVQYRLMATIVEITKQFMKNNQAKSIYFHAADSDPKRANLYYAYAKGNIEQEYSIFSFPDYSYTIEKNVNKINADELQKIISFLNKEGGYITNNKPKMSESVMFYINGTEFRSRKYGHMNYYALILEWAADMLSYPDLKYMPKIDMNQGDDEVQQMINHTPAFIRDFLNKGREYGIQMKNDNQTANADSDNNTAGDRDFETIHETISNLQSQLDEIIMAKDRQTYDYTNEEADDGEAVYLIDVVEPQKQIDTKYRLTFQRTSRQDNVWDIAFREAGGDYETVTNLGVPMKLMATISKITKDFLNKKQIDVLTYHPIDNDIRRGKLYMEYVRGNLGSDYDVFYIDNNEGGNINIERRTNDYPKEVLQKFITGMMNEKGTYFSAKKNELVQQGSDDWWQFTKYAFYFKIHVPNNPSGYVYTHSCRRVADYLPKADLLLYADRTGNVSIPEEVQIHNQSVMSKTNQTVTNQGVSQDKPIQERIGEMQSQLDEIIMAKDRQIYQYDFTNDLEYTKKFLIHVVEPEKHINADYELKLYKNDDDDDAWEIAFKKYESGYTEITNEGVPMKLMATIAAIIKNFVYSYGINTLVYHPVNGDERRGRLYMEYVKGNIGQDYDIFIFGNKSTHGNPIIIDKRTNNIPKETIDKFINGIQDGKYYSVLMDSPNYKYDSNYWMFEKYGYGMYVHIYGAQNPITTQSPRKFIEYVNNADELKFVNYEGREEKRQEVIDHNERVVNNYREKANSTMNANVTNANNNTNPVNASNNLDEMIKLLGEIL